ncbi:hypothetical protein SAY87_007663 [Trapa incisa]|uniref:Transcription repressor n=1 Tax=Trapa incisa TaxID=236973 RepID=A0AAN7QF72_9MYRT|nr:hypothetical protein SAY87_007663 [Trapa incisa]
MTPSRRTSSVIAAEESDDRWDRSVHGDLDEEEEDDDDDEADKGVALYVVVESRDPYRDFRASMEEMVEADQVTEDLRLGYPSVNDRTNHSYILRAFVDLLLRHRHRRT